MTLNRLSTIAVVLLCAPLAFAQLGAAYVGKVLTQAISYGGEKLEYNELGQLQNKGTICPWTLCAKIRVTDLHADGTLLHIHGERLFLTSTRTGFADILTVPGWRFINAKTEKRLRQMAHVQIDIQRQAGWDAESIDQAISRAFINDSDNLAIHLPNYWRAHICEQSGTSDSCGADSNVSSALKVNSAQDGGVRITAPRATHAPDPQYTEVARLAGFQGTTVLGLVVTPNGEPTDIKLTRAIGLGLDDQAVAAVSKWRFQPATREGKPVAVQINVEVNFRLY